MYRNLYAIFIVFNGVWAAASSQRIPQRQQQLLNLFPALQRSQQDFSVDNVDTVFPAQPQPQQQQAANLNGFQTVQDLNGKVPVTGGNTENQLTFLPVPKQQIPETTFNRNDNFPQQHQAAASNAWPWLVETLTERPKPRITAPLPVTTPEPTTTPASTKENSTVSASGKKNATQSSGLSGYESYISAGVAALGAVLGKDQCQQKAACLAASMLPSVQGRDLAIVAAERFVPEQWKPVYTAVKSSVFQALSCSQYTCTF